MNKPNPASANQSVPFAFGGPSKANTLGDARATMVATHNAEIGILVMACHACGFTRMRVIW
jgi:hypothetical protein